MVKCMIGYANRNGTVHYIETEWFPQLHGMLLTIYNSIERVMQLVNQNHVDIVEHAHKFFTKDFDIPYYFKNSQIVLDYKDDINQYYKFQNASFKSYFF